LFRPTVRLRARGGSQDNRSVADELGIKDKTILVAPIDVPVLLQLILILIRSKEIMEGHLRLLPNKKNEPG
jgi:hypothetical protein